MLQKRLLHQIKICACLVAPYLQENSDDSEAIRLLHCSAEVAIFTVVVDKVELKYVILNKHSYAIAQHIMGIYPQLINSRENVAAGTEYPHPVLVNINFSLGQYCCHGYGRNTCQCAL